MHNPVQITLRGIPRSDALERYIGEEVRKLDRACDGIVRCHVTAEMLHPPKRQKARFAVRLNLTLPGTEVAVNRDDDGDIYMAMHAAFEAAGSQLKDRMSRIGDAGRRPRNGKANSTRSGGADVKGARK